MNVDAKERFAMMKYEQLLSDKYFIETRFSKKFESKSSMETLRDIRMDIKSFRQKEHPTSFHLNIDCED